METNQNQNHPEDRFHPPPSSSSFKSSPLPADSHNSPPQLDLYTIPTHSCWFSWNSIHETERTELREFFDNSSFTRSTKIYKEYRDFIISKYREDPSRRLTFTEVRKSLVGDVCVLKRVFNFLDKWGLINFGAPPPPPPLPEVVDDDDGVKVRVEEGAPFGVRVVAAPGSLKQLVAPVLAVTGRDGAGRGGGGSKVVRKLASYTDVFPEAGVVGGEKGKAGELVCGNCKEKCDSKYYECTKENYTICLKCFEDDAIGENKVREDFKINDSIESSPNQGSVWTEKETLLLLEAVLGHGDDWELVAQNVQSKTKHECISRLIELPFGELILGSREKLLFKASVDEGDVGIVQSASLSAVPNPNSSVSACADQNALVSTGPNQIASVSAGPNQNAVISTGADQNVSISAGPDQIISSANAPGQNSSVVAARQHESLVDDSQVQEPSRATGQEDKVSVDADGAQKASSDADPEQKAESTQKEKASSEFLIGDNNHQEILDNHQKQILENHHEENTEKECDDDIEHLEPPLKKSRIDNSSDPSRSLMEQVSLISTMVGPQITAAAANAAVTVLSEGNPEVVNIFYVDDHSSTIEQRSGNLDVEMERALISEDSEMKDASDSSEVDKILIVRESIPLALQTRAAVGTALGAAAAHARLLADQEEKEMEHLVAFVIETQLKKLECKVKLFEDLEHLMQKEHAALEESKDSIIAQRMEILQRIVGEGLSRLRDYKSLRLTSHSV